MARERPFKDELKAYRKALYRPRDPRSEKPDERSGSSNSADRKHLQRWENDSRAQEIWDKFKEHNPTASPNELIKPVLKARREARAWIARMSMTSDWPKIWHRHYAQHATEIFAQCESLADATAEIGVLYDDMLVATEVLEL